MKVVGYIRVSTKGQAERGLGLEVQEEGIRAWAEREGHDLVSIYRDEGISGANGLADRQGLPDALASLQDGDASGIVVYRLDRLARDLVLQETLLTEIRRLGATTFSTFASEDDYLKDDPDDPSRKLIRQILGAVSEYDKTMIVLRLRGGRRRKQRKGGYTGGPRFADKYGFKLEGGEWVPVEAEQRVLRLASDLRSDGRTLREIAEILAEQGHRPKAGGSWHANSVRRLLAAK